MKTISYYELLKMIKDGNIPKKVNYKITGYLENYVEYTAQYDGNDFTHYELTNRHREDENIHFYLNENYLESDMFDESILIIEEKKKIPEKLNWKPKESMAGKLTQKEQIEVIARRTEKLKKEFNNLLDYLKSKGDE